MDGGELRSSSCFWRRRCGSVSLVGFCRSSASLNKLKLLHCRAQRSLGVGERCCVSRRSSFSWPRGCASACTVCRCKERRQSLICGNFTEQLRASKLFLCGGHLVNVFTSGPELPQPGVLGLGEPWTGELGAPGPALATSCPPLPPAPSRPLPELPPT